MTGREVCNGAVRVCTGVEGVSVWVEREGLSVYRIREVFFFAALHILQYVKEGAVGVWVRGWVLLGEGVVYGI